MPRASRRISRAALEEAQGALGSTLAKCRKVQPKLRAGSPQATLLRRRIHALELALTLIRRELATRAARRPRPHRPA